MARSVHWLRLAQRVHFYVPFLSAVQNASHEGLTFLCAPLILESKERFMRKRDTMKQKEEQWEIASETPWVRMVLSFFSNSDQEAICGMTMATFQILKGNSMVIILIEWCVQLETGVKWMERQHLQPIAVRLAIGISMPYAVSCSRMPRMNFTTESALTAIPMSTSTYFPSSINA